MHEQKLNEKDWSRFLVEFCGRPREPARTSTKAQTAGDVAEPAEI